MIVLFVWILFLTGVGFNLYMLAVMDIRRIDFIDGILVGQLYYIIVPMTFFLCTGVAGMADLPLTYRPYEDLDTTAIVILGLFLLPALRLVLPRTCTCPPDTSDPRIFPTVAWLFLVTAALSFFLSGLSEGGHWQDSLDAAFDNPVFLPIKYTANVARNAIFAVLLYRVTIGRMRLRQAILYGLLFTLIDLFTTFNRITAVYFLIMILLLLKDKPVRMLIVGTVSLTVLSFVSAIWPIFRGLATRQGYTLESFVSAWDLAQRASTKVGGTLDTSLNGVFESTNLVVLNWIVDNFGDAQRPYLVYAMFVRPLTVLLPGGIWPGRPSTIGVTLGTEIAGVKGLALNSTMYGEAFANFGWFWPLGLALFLSGSHLAFRALGPRSRVVQMIGAFTAIAFWRFDSSYVGSTAILLGVLLAVLWAVRTGKRRKQVSLFPIAGKPI